MQVLQIAVGSVILHGGRTYTLHQIHNDGGYQLVDNATGKYALDQPWYSSEAPTVEWVEQMITKHLRT